MKKIYIQPQVTMYEIRESRSLMATSAEIKGETKEQLLKGELNYDDGEFFGW